MIKIENTDVFGWESAIRGLRNPMNSWAKSDSKPCEKGIACDYCPHDHRCRLMKYGFNLGENDLKLMKNLSKAGNDHAKYLRMINVTCDITAPLYWWKEYDTYKVGTVANSCSTMHKIHTKEFTLDDFSLEHCEMLTMDVFIQHIIPTLNIYRKLFCGIESGDRKGQKSDWWQMIQLLPSSYNQKRTVQLNYQVLKNMYFSRRHHKLDEWREFCAWCETLPYFKEICILEDNNNE